MHQAIAEPPAGRASIMFGPLSYSIRPGVPFQADYTERFLSRTRGREQPAERSGVVYVDGRGRTRVDDLTTGVASVFDPERGGWSMRPSSSRSATGWARSWPVAPEEVHGDREALLALLSARRDAVGTREIDGLTCEGWRKRHGSDEIEVWEAVKLGAPMRFRQAGRAGELTIRLDAVVLGEPAPKLFDR